MIEPIISAWDLGVGETHVLSWAYQHKGYQAIVDDLAARNCAKSLGISICGTIGVILTAKKKSKISEIKTILNRLLEANFRISDQLFDSALRLANER